MAANVPGDLVLTSLQGGEGRPISEWVTTFQLALVALDPYTRESAWILPTGERVLRTFAEADCRTAFLMTCDADDARQFLGPLVEDLLVLIDPDRQAVRAMGLSTLPAFVHIDQACGIVGITEGWDPAAWREVATGLAEVMSWKRPHLPVPSDPMPFDGSPSMTEAPTTE